ncbi:MAG: hypothetical protein ACI4TU_00325 [Candidatus Cryptobacteroides sp.]
MHQLPDGWKLSQYLFGEHLLDITVSDYLEKNATEEQREMGADLADWVVEERLLTGKGIRERGY